MPMMATKATPSSKTFVRWGEAIRARNIIATCGARLPPAGGGAAVASDALLDLSGWRSDFISSRLTLIILTKQ